MNLGHACFRVCTVRRVTRRANDDDTLISRRGRGSFFKGQPGRELLNAMKVEGNYEQGGNKKAMKKKKTKKKRFSLHAEANVRNDS